MVFGGAEELGAEFKHAEGGGSEVAYEIDSLQAGPYGRVPYILLRAYNSRFCYIWFL